MFIPRAGRPGLLGTAVRTAVIAGTAQATAGAVARRQQERAEWRQASQPPAAPPVAATPPVAAAPPVAAPVASAVSGTPDGLIDQLQKLATLHSAGALTDAEFAAAKSSILG